MLILKLPDCTVTTFLNLEALHTRVLVNQAENEPERQTAGALAAGLSCPVCMAALQKGWIACLC